MNLQDMLNQGGATLDAHLNPIDLKDGYVVSIHDVDKIPIANLAEISMAMLKASNLAIDSGDNVGLWVDNGFVYVDVSRRYNTYMEAMQVAREKNQKAIYSAKHDASILVSTYCTFDDLKALAKKLAGSQGFYGRLSAQLEEVCAEGVDEVNACFAVNNIKDDVGMVMWLEQD